MDGIKTFRLRMVHSKACRFASEDCTSTEYKLHTRKTEGCV